MKYFKWFSFDNILLFFLLVVLAIESLNIIKIHIPNPLIIVVAIVGTLPIIYSSIQSIKDKKVSVDLLASIALIFSLIEGEWLSAIFINLMLTCARLLSSYNEARAKKNLESLMKLKPVKVKVLRGDNIVQLFYSEVSIGDIVMVDLGERIPVDGTVLAGTAAVDESSLTGESLPVNKILGDKALSSGLVVSGNLTIKTEKVGGETTLEKIIKLVEKAQLDKPDIRTKGEKFAAWYLSIMFIVTITLFVVTHNTSLILAVLLVTCADDIAVAIPLTFLTAISLAAKRGIIIKGASYLEALKDVKVIFVDKTGTLTKGKLKTENFICVGADRDEVLKYAAVCAGRSTHPISKAIVDFTSNINKSETKAPETFTEISGNGIEANFGKKEFLLGKLDYLKNHGVDISENDFKNIYAEQENGFNLTFVAFDNKYKGYFIVADEIKENIKESIEELKKLGVERIIMLTGDNEKVARRIQEMTGITDYYANILPEEKLNHIKANLNNKYKVAMIGDGINDAAALSLADVGIAMGAIGYDVAIDAADIVLMRDNFASVPEMIRFSKDVMKITNNDFIIWGVTNAIGLGLVFLHILTPTSASAYNFISDFFPVLNSAMVFKTYTRK